MIRRIIDDNGGFVKDISDIIAIEAWKNPSLVPDLSKEKTLFVFSDYSRIRGYYKTYSFFVLGRSGADYFNTVRKELRREFRLGNRRISFKKLNDRLKLRALPAFLSIAGAVDGFVLTLAVDSKIQSMFAEQFLEVWPELCSVKKAVLEDMLRVVHFGAQAVMTGFTSQQNIVWFTDDDSIVANEAHQQLFGRIAETLIRKMFMPDDQIGRVGFGLAGIDDGSLEIEDFVAVPDLVAGALCEMFDSLAKDKLHITSRIVLNKPAVSRKSNLICEWIGKARCPLKKFGVVVDKTGPGQYDWRPTFFQIQNAEITDCEIMCSAQRVKNFALDPVRFDIVDPQR
jgi:hypothetical protein